MQEQDAGVWKKVCEVGDTTRWMLGVVNLNV